MTASDKRLPLCGLSVFISGPMSGIEHYNAPEFARAHAVCREQGALSVYDPSWGWMCDAVTGSHEFYMQRCIHELTTPGSYDTLLQLDGWEASDGAVLEFEVARACGMRCVTLREVTGDAEE